MREDVRSPLLRLLGSGLLVLLLAGNSWAEEEEAYLLKPGEFPQPDTAHYVSGELVKIDHVNRTGILRSDRTDELAKRWWDLPHEFEMLPFGTIYYHGAPAELRDIPIGTHLHGSFYLGEEEEPDRKKRRGKPNSAYDSAYNRCFRLEDDFSYHQRRGESWKVKSVDLEAGKLVCDGPNGETTFDLDRSTRIWHGKQIGTLEDIAPGQEVQLNVTWATLYGPGHCLDIWLDEEARQLAAQRQRQVHLHYQHRRGLAGRIENVEHLGRGKGIVTVVLFGGMAPELYDDFQTDITVTAVVAEPSLRSYDQINDRKRGQVLEIERKKDPPPGSSGITLKFQTDELLEGFRPQRIIRVFAPGWPITTLPREERLWPADLRQAAK